MEGLHNFYPHPHTGLAAAYVARQNALLHRNGLRAGLFLSGRQGRRAPMHEGLPTVEAWRDLAPARAAAPALATGCDFLILSESRPSRKEMEDLVAAVQAWEAEGHAATPTGPSPEPAAASLLFHVKPAAAAGASGRAVLEMLWTRPLSNRPDPPAGTLCVDNELYGRYQGEVEIVTVPRPADRRTNVLGHLGPEALPSLQAVGPGTSFRLLPEA